MDPLRAEDARQVGPFRLLCRLGAGGMGQVYLGASAGGRQVAVKVIYPHLAGDADFRRRFAREVAAARQVGGFHTALVVDADPDAPAPWMATAYIPGPSLHAAITSGGPLDVAGTRRLGAALAEGLSAIHACGLIHRDLTPRNIILGAGGPCIIDFGVAKHTDMTSMTESGMMIGTLRFMSPEQLTGLELSPLSDVFSLGAVLAYAATARDPFRASTIPAVITRILHDPPDLAPLDGPLRDLLASCLAKEATARPSVADLLAALADAPTDAPGPGPAADGPAAPAATPTPAATVTANAPVPPVAAREAAGAAVLPAESAAGPASRDAARAGREAAPGGRRYGRSALLAATAVVVAGLAIGGVLLSADPPHSPGPTGGPTLQDRTSRPPTAHPSVSSHPSTAHPPVSSHPATSKPVPAGYTASGSRQATLAVPVSVRDPGALGVVAFTPDGSMVVAGGTQVNYIYEWDVASRSLVVSQNFAANVLGIADLAFSAKDGTFATADGQDAASLWTTGTAAHITRLGVVSGNAESVAFSPDGGTVALGADDGSVTLWNARTEAQIKTIPQGQPVSSVAFSPDGSVLAASGAYGMITIWRTGSWSRLKTLTDSGSRGAGPAAFSPDGRLLAVGDQNGDIYLWSTSTWKPVGRLTGPAGKRITGLAFSGRDGILAANDSNGSAYLWNTTTGQRTATLTDPAGQNPVPGAGFTGPGGNTAAFSPDGTTLAAADPNGYGIALWTIAYHAP